MEIQYYSNVSLQVIYFPLLIYLNVVLWIPTPHRNKVVQLLEFHLPEIIRPQEKGSIFGMEDQQRQHVIKRKWSYNLSLLLLSLAGHTFVNKVS